jgi:integrase
MRTRSPRGQDQKALERIQKKIDVATLDEDRIWKKLRNDLRLERRGESEGFSDFADVYYNNWCLDHNKAARKKKSRLNILKDHFKDLPIDCVNIRDIDSFISKRKKQGRSNRTINHDMTVLRHMLNWAITRDYIDSNPCDKWEELDEVEWVGERPDDTVVDAIMSHIDVSMDPLYWFLRETGCRRGEAITLRRTQLFIPDDPAKAVVTFHKITKNNKSRRVPLTEKAIWAVNAMPEHGGFVFYRPDTMKPWDGDAVDWFWEKARKNVLVYDDEEGESAPSKLRVHDLRHAYVLRGALIQGRCV